MGLLEFYKDIVAVQTELGGLAGLARVLTAKIQKPVIITDVKGFVHTLHCPPELSINAQEHISLPSIMANNRNAPSMGIIVLGGTKEAVACWPIGNQKIQGYLLVLADQAEITPDLSQAAELVSLAILVELTQQQEMIKREHKYKDEFIRDLLFGNFDNMNEIQKIGKLWDYNFALPYAVLVLEPRHGSNTQEGDMLNLRDQLEKAIAAAIAGSIVGVLGDVLVALIPCKDHELPSWKNHVRKAYKTLVPLFADHAFYTGVGKLNGKADKLYRGYQQAKVALELGKMVHSTYQPVFFDELGAIRLFYNLNERDLNEFFQEVLGPLEKHDRENNGQLLLTLWHYLSANCESSIITEKLFIHRNTLRYRLQKIEKLLDVSLGDEEKKFNIHAALKVAAILGKVNYTN